MMATCVIQPIDMVKVRIQLKSEQVGRGGKISPFGVISEMLANGRGIGQFYKGLDSALIRQITYTTTRMGIYKSLMSHHEHTSQGKVTLGYKMLFSATAGFIGSLVGNPADLILIRLQADQTLPEESRRNYKNFGDAFKRIIKEEGVMNLWKGSTPTVVRAVVLNLGMLAPFDEAKERLTKFYGEEKETLSIRV